MKEKENFVYGGRDGRVVRTEQNIDSGVSSVKVHAPPGGVSNWSIGGYVDDTNTKQSRRGGNSNQNASSGFMSQYEVPTQKQEYEYRPHERQDDMRIGHQQPAYQQPAYQQPKQEEVFGMRVGSGSNSGPHTGVPSTKVHAPPGGKSNFQFY